MIYHPQDVINWLHLAVEELASNSASWRRNIYQVLMCKKSNSPFRCSCLSMWCLLLSLRLYLFVCMLPTLRTCRPLYLTLEHYIARSFFALASFFLCLCLSHSFLLCTCHCLCMVLFVSLVRFCLSIPLSLHVYLGYKRFIINHCCHKQWRAGWFTLSWQLPRLLVWKDANVSFCRVQRCA